jgi:protein-disulfide isomerase
MQCPDCARAHPLVYDVAKAQNVPVVRHDFPLPMHNWAFEAAVWARYWDSKSKKLGEAFRDYIYKNQPAINPQNLESYVRKFAEANGTTMPFVRDPGKKLEAAVKADYALGQKIGVQHTPTIWVVGATKGAKAEPFVEVVDRSQMSKMIDDMRRAATAAASSKSK